MTPLKRIGELSLTVLLAAAGFAIPATAGTITYDTSLAAPGFYNGTGNANTNFTVAAGDGIELGLSAVIRFVGPVDPGAGSNTYNVPTGVNGGDALWDVEFSINTRAGGGSNDLSAYTFSAQVEDLTDSVTGPSVNPVTAGDSFWDGVETNTFSPSTEWGAQNAENLSFGGGALLNDEFDPNATDDYLVTLTATDLSNDTVITDTIHVDATPEPASIFSALAGLGSLALFGRRLSTGHQE